MAVADVRCRQRFDNFERAQEKLAPLLRHLHHNSIADAVADLGQPEQIGQLFASFQRHLYAPPAGPD